MKPKWLFFDLGSTLVDETIAYRYRVLEAIEGSAVSYEQFDNKRIEYAKTLSAGDKEAAKFYNLTLKPWRNDKEKLYDGVSEILTELSRRGYRLAVLANQAKGTCDRLLNWGILHFFDIVLASFEEGMEKPDLEFFRLALKKADCLPGEACMIGDRLDNDIYPAKVLGFKTVFLKQGVVGPYHEPDPQKGLPDYTALSLKELLDIFE